MWIIVILLSIVVIFMVISRSREDYTEEEIPKIIWSYWDREDMPDFIKKCIEKWRELNPLWSIRILNPGNLSVYLPEVDIFSFKFADTKPRQSDFVRLHILAKYGGVWCDASMIPREPFDWVIEEQKKRKVEFLGYYRDGATTKTEYPVIESWFFANIPGSNFVSKWRDELGVMNSLEKESDYQENVKARGVDIQNIPQPDYLNVYLSAQAVLQKQMSLDEIKSNLHLIKAEDGPFKHSHETNWDHAKSMKWLCDTPTPALPSLIKVYGVQRQELDKDSELDCAYKIFDP